MESPWKMSQAVHLLQDKNVSSWQLAVTPVNTAASRAPIFLYPSVSRPEFLQGSQRCGQELAFGFSDSVCQSALSLVFLGSWIKESHRKMTQAAHLLQNTSVQRWPLVVSSVNAAASRGVIFLQPTVSRPDFFQGVPPSARQRATAGRARPLSVTSHLLARCTRTSVICRTARSGRQVPKHTLHLVTRRSTSSVNQVSLSISS